MNSPLTEEQDLECFQLWGTLKPAVARQLCTQIKRKWCDAVSCKIASKFTNSPEHLSKSQGGATKNYFKPPNSGHLKKLRCLCFSVLQIFRPYYIQIVCEGPWASVRFFFGKLFKLLFFFFWWNSGCVYLIKNDLMWGETPEFRKAREENLVF